MNSRSLRRGLLAVTLITSACADPDPATEFVLEPDPGAEPGLLAWIYVHWTPTGGERGVSSEVRSWSSDECARTVVLDELREPPSSERLDLSVEGLGDGEFSVGWIGVDGGGGWSMTAPDDVLLYLGADAPEGSWVARLVGVPLSAGVHLLSVREWTDDEIAALEACEASAENPALACPAMKMHLSLAESAYVRLVVGDQRPDLD